MNLPAACLSRAAQLIASGQRKILGIVAAPGAGKSTLAQALAAHFAPFIQVVPMDGFHLANAQLHRLNLAHCKGAPETFDTAGYVQLLRRIRTQQPGDDTVYAPDFRRELEEPVAAAIAVQAHMPLVVTEGNYLLLEEGGWQAVRQALDEVWFLQVDESLRLQRLLARHLHFGRTEQQAQRWIGQTDQPNALRIEQTRHRADVQINLSLGSG